jgi:hypothetical protein
VIDVAGRAIEADRAIGALDLDQQASDAEGAGLGLDQLDDLAPGRSLAPRSGASASAISVSRVGPVVLRAPARLG